MASVEATDWRLGLSLQQRVQYMLEGHYLHDVTFLVGEGNSQETIRAHWFPLIAGSVEFESIFESRREDDNRNPIVVTDVSPTAFKSMLRYMYYEQVTITENSVLSLLSTSTKFRVSQLTALCVEFLEQSIKVDSVCTVLVASVRYNDTALRQKCIDFICDNASSVLKSANFSELCQKSLMLIVKSDHLCSLSEVDIFKASIRWAEAECARKSLESCGMNMKTVLGDILYQIRFPTMNHNEIAETIHLPQLLTSSDRGDIHDHIALHGRQCSTCSCKTPFNKKPRNIPSDPSRLTIRRFLPENVSYALATKTNISAIEFVCNKPVALEAVGIYGGNSAANTNVTLAVYEEQDEPVDDEEVMTAFHEPLAIMELPIQSDGTKVPKRLDFTKPIPLTCGTRYSVVTTFDWKMHSYYGQEGASRVVQNGLSVKFYDSTRASPAVCGLVNQGQIPELHFKVEATTTHT